MADPDLERILDYLDDRLPALQAEAFEREMSQDHALRNACDVARQTLGALNDPLPSPPPALEEWANNLLADARQVREVLASLVESPAALVARSGGTRRIRFSCELAELDLAREASSSSTSALTGQFTDSAGNGIAEVEFDLESEGPHRQCMTTDAFGQFRATSSKPLRIRLFLPEVTVVFDVSAGLGP